MPQINQEVLNKLKGDETLQLSIATGMGKKFRTIERWLRDNDEILASKAVVLLIKEFTGLSEVEIVETETATA